MLSVRARSDADLPGCVDGLRLVHELDRYPVRWPDDPAGWLTPRELLTAWVADDGGEVVGHAVLRNCRDHHTAPIWCAATGLADGAHGEVSRVFAHPGVRGRGVGRLLLETAAAEARARGLHPVLEVMAHNTAATALYERTGWARVGTREFETRDGSVWPVYCYVAAG